MRKKICFIINPISGIGKQKIVEPLLAEKFLAKDFEVQISYTDYPKHATALCIKAVEDKYDSVVAIGGDGSVNEVSRGLINTEVKLGIVPCGSGNGYARHLGIPIDIRKSLDIIHTGKSIKSDTLVANKEPIVNIAGLGFDAHVAHVFATYGKRGFSTYIKIVLREFLNFKELLFLLDDGKEKRQEKAFIFSIANASQYGNNAFISPHSIINDGKMEICVLKKIPFYLLPVYAFRIFNRKLINSSYYRVFSCSKIKIVAPSGKIHIDGEAIEINSEIEFEVNPLSLNVIVP